MSPINHRDENHEEVGVEMGVVPIQEGGAFELHLRIQGMNALRNGNFPTGQNVSSTANWVPDPGPGPFHPQPNEDVMQLALNALSVKNAEGDAFDIFYPNYRWSQGLFLVRTGGHVLSGRWWTDDHGEVLFDLDREL